MKVLVRQLRQLRALTDALSDAQTVQAVLRAFHAHAGLTTASAGSVSLIDDDQLILGPTWGFAPELIAAWRVIPLDAQTPLTQVARTGVENIVPDAPTLQRDFAVGQLPPSPPRAAYVSLPLEAHGQVLGVLGLRIDAAELEDERHLDFLRCIATDLGSALGRGMQYDRMVQALEREQRVLGMLSHDLRTPLGAIVMTADLLERVEGVQSVHVELIRRSAVRAAEIVDNILDYSRSGASASQVCSIDLLVQLTSQVEELQVTHPGRALLLDCPIGLPLVSGDPASVGQIVSNLVRNAFQHGAEDRPVIVRAEGTDGGVAVTVINEGTPIPMEERAALFEPFHRGSGTRGNGTGLGLHIVRELARRQNASLHLRSDESSTRFQIVFQTCAAAPVRS